MKAVSLLAISLSLFAGTTIAQESAVNSGKTTFGIRAGVNFQNIDGKNSSGQSLKFDMVPGFHLGLNAEMPLGKDFYFQPGLMFTTKGAKDNYMDMGQEVDQRINLSYLEVPLNLVYKPMLGSGKLILGFGPYVGFGMGGKVTFESGGMEEEFDVKFKSDVSASDDSEKAYFKPLDMGASILAGYEFSNRFSFQLNASLGLTKINPEYEGIPDTESSWKNVGFGVSLGYRFN